MSFLSCENFSGALFCPSDILDFLFWFFLFILFFLLMREVFCWYWKINHRLSVLKKIEENTRCKCQKKEG